MGELNGSFFDAIDNVLGHTPSTQPPVVVESAASSYFEVSEMDNEGDTNEESIQDSGSHSRSVTPSPAVAKRKEPNKSKGKGTKRKRAVCVVERVDDVIEKVIQFQEDSERNFMRLEEQMLEAEERRRKDNQQFMLQMMQLIATPHNTRSPFQAFLLEQCQIPLPTLPLTPSSSSHPPQPPLSTSTSPSAQVNYGLHPMYSFTTPERD